MVTHKEKPTKISQDDLIKRFEEVKGAPAGPFPKGVSSLEEKIKYIGEMYRMKEALTEKRMDDRVKDLTQRFERMKGAPAGPFPEGVSSLKEKGEYLAEMQRTLKAQRIRQQNDESTRKMQDTGQEKNTFDDLKQKLEKLTGRTPLVDLPKSTLVEKGIIVDEKNIVESSAKGNKKEGNGVIKDASSEKSRASTNFSVKEEKEVKVVNRIDSGDVETQTNRKSSTDIKSSIINEKKGVEIATQTDSGNVKTQTNGKSSTDIKSSIMEGKKGVEIATQPGSGDTETRTKNAEKKGFKTESKKPKVSDQKDQDSKKDKGFTRNLIEFIKKILEKLIFNDHEVNYSVAADDKENNQEKSNSSSIVREKIQSSERGNNPSLIQINQEKFNLEPGKEFNYQSVNINICITYNSIAQFEQTSVTMMNININGEGHNIQPDTRFHYKNQGLEVDVKYHQHSRNYDIVDKSLSKCNIEGLKGLEYNTNVPTNTPNVKERGSGRGI